MRAISYNLCKNRAAGEIETLARRYSPDLLCLQEVDTHNLPQRIRHLRLAHSTESNRLGLAMYVRADRFEVLAAKNFSLKKSLHDRLLAPANERLLGVRLADDKTGEEVVAASFHAAPLTASNRLRRNQIHAALGGLAGLGSPGPTLMIGDYNYPIFQDRLRAEMKRVGYDLSVSETRTYKRYRVFRGYFDFATSARLAVDGVLTLPAGGSDHMPIMLSAERPRRADRVIIENGNAHKATALAVAA